MKIVASAGREDIAVVYVGEYPTGELIEFVEAVQPPIPREEKFVLMISTLYGCPVQCEMCDAGGFYHGKVSKERMFEQIDAIVIRHYPDRVIPCKQFKIQFARMGEPSFNPDVLELLEEFPSRYQAPGFMPSISTIAPHGREEFFEKLLEIKNRLYSDGNFQFQFSLHTSNQEQRKKLVPVKTWDFEQMAAFGERWYQPGDRKVTLNFALADGHNLKAEELLPYFDPEKFLIKITPLNPTHRAQENMLSSFITESNNGKEDLVKPLEEAGYQVVVAIGDLEENRIGSNCGQYVLRHLDSGSALPDGYTYQINN